MWTSRRTAGIRLILALMLVLTSCSKKDLTFKPSSWPKFAKDTWRMDYRGVAFVAHSWRPVASTNRLEPSVEVINGTDAEIRVQPPEWRFRGQVLHPIAGDVLSIAPHTQRSLPYAWKIPPNGAEILASSGVVINYSATIEDEQISYDLVLVP
jgi:hypothetical protein